MHPPARKSPDQLLLAGVLILLSVLAAILLFKWLGQREPGKSRVDWPVPATGTTKP